MNFRRHWAKLQSVDREKPGLYKVVGASGMTAGSIQSYKGGWLLSLYSMPREDFRFLRDAKASALEYAKRY